MPDDPDDLPRDTIAVEPAAVPTIQVTPNLKTPSNPSDLWSGEHEKSAFGRFEIIDIIGAGGMGVVLSANDPQLQRKVAIKVLRTRGLTGDRRHREAERLLREARALAQLSHPNVVTVYEAGTIDDRVFIAMELIDGLTLRSWQLTRDKPAILDVYIKAGRGLAAGHAAGVVHRDFKPDNVLIGTDGRVRVIDFGLAQPGRGASESGDITEVPSAGSRVTFETTTSFGTPVYMAPEQHNRDKADARADQFAFCVALYEALYGKLPFAGTTYGELVVNVSSGSFLVPPVGVVPAAVAAAIRRGLSTDPNARFPSMDALLEAISPVPKKKTGLVLAVVGGAVVLAVGATLAVVKLTAEPAVNPCEGGGERLTGVWDAATRAKVRAAFVATKRTHAASTFDRVATGLDAYAGDWVARQRDVCEATNVRHERSEAALDAGTRCLAIRLDQLHALTSLFATADAQVADSAIAAVEALPPLAACATTTATPPTGPLQAQLPGIVELVEVGKSARAIEQAKPLLAKATSDPQAAAELYFQYGRALDKLGQGPDAELALHEAARLAAVAKDDVVAAKAWTELVKVVGYTEQRVDEGLELVKVAEVAIQRADAQADIGAELAYNIGSVYYGKGMFDKARASFEKALDIQTKRYGENHAATGRIVNSIGGCLLNTGDIPAARKAFERALAIDDKVLGPSHPDTALVLANLGAVAQKQGDVDAAAKSAERALAILEEVQGKDSLDVALTLNNLGGFALARLDFPKANEQLTRAIAIFDKIDPDNPRVALPLIGRAQARDGLGDLKGALGDAERAVKVLDRKGTDPGQLADARLNLADVLWDNNGDHKRAIALATDAQKAYTETANKTKIAIAKMWLATHN